MNDVNDTFQDDALHSHNLLVGTEVRPAKIAVVQEINATALRHVNIPELKFFDYPVPAHLKKAVEQRLAELDEISTSYAGLIEDLEAVHELEWKSLRDRFGEDATEFLNSPEIARYSNIELKLAEQTRELKNAADEEISRLLQKLEELNAKPAAPPKPVKTKNKNRPGPALQPQRPSASRPEHAPLPANRVQIRTLQQQELTGKPRADNPDIVDILDSRGQRKETYLKSSSGQFWERYSELGTPAPTTARLPPVTGRVQSQWARIKAKVDAVLEAAEASERVADYTIKKATGAPGTAQGLLEQSANHLEEAARELDELNNPFLSNIDRNHYSQAAAQLRSKATGLRKKGDDSRLALILKKNPTAYDLDYLANKNLAAVTLRPPRREVDTMVLIPPAKKPEKRTDFIDTYDIKVQGKLWAVGHFHYVRKDSPVGEYTVAHLKAPAQQYEGMKAQAAAAEQGRRYTIHRGELQPNLVRKLFLKEP